MDKIPDNIHRYVIDDPYSIIINGADFNEQLFKMAVNEVCNLKGDCVNFIVLNEKKLNSSSEIIKFIKNNGYSMPFPCMAERRNKTELFKEFCIKWQ